MFGWAGCFFAPGASRVSPRRASYFFLLRQKKVTKKKASHVRAASRCLALLAAFGALANSLRSNNASALIRTLLRCSARPNGGGIPLGSSASRTSPEWLVRFANFARMARPLRASPEPREGVGTSLTPGSSASFARMARPLRDPSPEWLVRLANSSLLTPRPNGSSASRTSPSSPEWLVARTRPNGSFLTPHARVGVTSFLTPHSSLLTPHSSLLTPRPIAALLFSGPARSRSVSRAGGVWRWPGLASSAVAAAW